MKFTKKRAKKIIELYAYNEHSITEICKGVGIDRSTFYEWRKTQPEFQKMLDDVEETRLSSLKELARSGLYKLLQGHEYEEVQTEYTEGKPDKDGNPGKPKVKGQKRVKKFIPPNATAVIFALKNTDPQTFADLVKTEISGDQSKPIITQNSVTHLYLPDNRRDSATSP